LNDYGNLMGREAFIGDEFKLDFLVSLAATFSNGPLDRVARDRRLASGLNRGGEPIVQVWVSASQLGGDQDFPDEFADDLAAFCGIGRAARLFPLRTHI